MRLLLLILAALKTAFLAITDFLFSFFLAPSRALRPQGRSVVAPPPAVADEIGATPRPAPCPSPQSMAPSLSRTQEEAVRVIQLAAARITGDVKAATTNAERLPTLIRAWAETLQVTELRRLIGARTSGVSAHLAGEKMIPGVRPLHPLAPAPVEVDAVADMDDIPSPATP